MHETHSNKTDDHQRRIFESVYSAFGKLYLTLDKTIQLTEDVESFMKEEADLDFDVNNESSRCIAIELHQNLKKHKTAFPEQTGWPTIIWLNGTDCLIPQNRPWSQPGFYVFNNFFTSTILKYSFPNDKKTRVKVYNALLRQEWLATNSRVSSLASQECSTSDKRRGDFVFATCPLCTKKFRFRRHWFPPLDTKGNIDWNQKWIGPSRNPRSAAKKHWIEKHKDNLHNSPFSIRKSNANLGNPRRSDGKYDYAKAQACWRRTNKSLSAT